MTSLGQSLCSHRPMVLLEDVLRPDPASKYPSLKQGVDMRFPDRNRAGQLLAEKLSRYAHRTDVVVMALPPGGVPVGYEIANALDVPLDVLVIRHLGLPSNPALAMGAVSADG